LYLPDVALNATEPICAPLPEHYRKFMFGQTKPEQSDRHSRRAYWHFRERDILALR